MTFNDLDLVSPAYISLAHLYSQSARDYDDNDDNNNIKAQFRSRDFSLSISANAERCGGSTEFMVRPAAKLLASNSPTRSVNYMRMDTSSHTDNYETRMSFGH